MTGSLQVKNGKYYIVLNIYQSNGKRKQKWISTDLPERGNKRKAEKLLRQTLEDYEAKSGLIASDVLFSDYLRSWLEQERRRVDEVTLQGYEALTRVHIVPYFDALGVKLQDVNRTVLQEYFDEKAEHGRTDGKGGLSPRSLRLHKNIINQACLEAIKNNLIPNNPCQFVELPKTVRASFSFYTAEQLQALFDAVKDDALFPLIKITAIYGLRRSELLGLKWDSLDLAQNRLIIKHTVSKVSKVVAKDKTKNASSYRSFPLVPEAIEIFQKSKADELRNRKSFGKMYCENDYVFTWPDGRPISPDYVSKHFQKLLNRNGLPHIRFHELRHSCASLLLSAGFTLKDVQEWLGHSDIKMTANVYGHLDTARKQTIADHLTGALKTAAVKNENGC